MLSRSKYTPGKTPQGGAQATGTAGKQTGIERQGDNLRRRRRSRSAANTSRSVGTHEGNGDTIRRRQDDNENDEGKSKAQRGKESNKKYFFLSFKNNFALKW